MPKIISFTPSWLSSPAPGHKIFTPALVKGSYDQATNYKGTTESSKRNTKPGPRRSIARRGTEVFIAVGKEIRWADLVYLKERWEEKEERRHGEINILEDDEDESQAQGYRVCRFYYLGRATC